MYRIPEDLAEWAQQRIEGFAVEGFVWGSGPAHPRIMLVGEAPGENELVTGIPFTGRAGVELMASLESAGLTRDEVYITSAVRSRPYRWGEKTNRDGSKTRRTYNRAPVMQEIIAHAPVLDREIKDLKPPLIVTLGNVGLRRLVGKEFKVTECHGRLLETPVLKWDEAQGDFIFTEERYKIFPTFHPASVFYNPKTRAWTAEDWKRIGELLELGE
ncbi:uracil-DNA glycosylase [Planomicrobium sp. YIM 101495]|uniref:uracil-DNA glycosylase n=1 Tax=Planomicrobium sp. YIM 101495 TaxID=2665160 RepID=UPI0012B999D0|nr:uracil-DNA glycosylase [Planomicrobium sp. YIM 101495]MTD31524.1 uracil-DNA glycosylase [Planomicrobium sp. YIM 101495]